MKSRDKLPQKEFSLSRKNRMQHKDTVETDTASQQSNVGDDKHTNALTPISNNAMNTLNSSNAMPSQGSPHPSSKTPNSTIRSVPSESLHLNPPTTHQEEESRKVKSRSGSPGLMNGKAQASSSTSGPPLTWQNNAPVSKGLVRSISSEFGPLKSYTGLSVKSPDEGSSSSNGLGSPNGPGNPESQWSSAVGRANLGKSGRVIEKLMSDVDRLKRDLNTEKSKREEAKRAVQMAEDKAEAIAADFEAKLHDATVNSTLLKRRERQLAEVKAQVDGEKLKAEKALEREQNWKEELERTRIDCEKKVVEAQMMVKLHEGRANTMENHWKDQEKSVSKTVVKLGVEIDDIVTSRRADDAKILRLEILHKQAQIEIQELKEKNSELVDVHEKYRKERDEGVKGFDEKTRKMMGETERLLEETRETAHKLKWALQLQQNENERLKS